MRGYQEKIIGVTPYMLPCDQPWRPGVPDGQNEKPLARRMQFQDNVIYQVTGAGLNKVSAL